MVITANSRKIFLGANSLLEDMHVVCAKWHLQLTTIEDTIILRVPVWSYKIRSSKLEKLQ